jgi:hypothetical protein
MKSSFHPGKVEEKEGVESDNNEGVMGMRAVGRLSIVHQE